MNNNSLSNDRPLVSIIVPCYNQAHFLADALASCFDQTHPNFEVLVVDDGSSDNTAQVASQFPAKYVRQSNAGLSAARNTGINASSGEYLVFLDSDDRLLPRALESNLELLENQPDHMMAAGNHSFISQSGHWLRYSTKPHNEKDPYLALLRSNFVENPGCAMYRRSLFEQIGAFDTSLRASEDYDLYLRIARGHKIRLNEEVVSEYRLHGSSMSRNPELMLLSTLKVLRAQTPYLRGDRLRKQAFRAGLSVWRRKYGRQLAIQLAQTRLRGDFPSVKRKVGALIREYPFGLVLALVGCLLPARILSIPEKRRLKSNIPAQNAATGF